MVVSVRILRAQRWIVMAAAIRCSPSFSLQSMLPNRHWDGIRCHVGDSRGKGRGVNTSLLLLLPVNTSGNGSERSVRADVRGHRPPATKHKDLQAFVLKFFLSSQEGGQFILHIYTEDGELASGRKICAITSFRWAR